MVQCTCILAQTEQMFLEKRFYLQSLAHIVIKTAPYLTDYSTATTLLMSRYFSVQNFTGMSCPMFTGLRYLVLL